jgi:hypothetical protein
MFPFGVIGIGCCSDVDVSDDGDLGRSDQFHVAPGAIFFSHLPAEGPLFVKVLLPDPAGTFLPVPSSGPSPQRLVYVVVYLLEHLLADCVAVIVGPPSKKRVEFFYREWIWQYVFPSQRLSVDPCSGVVRRHHLDESGLQKAVRAAAQAAGMTEKVSCHTFRHSFATHLLENGYDIRTVQEFLGHRDVKTTMIDTHVLNRGGLAVRSPLD